MESQAKLHELESQLLELKNEMNKSEYGNDIKQQLKLQQEKEHYKNECNKLRKDLASQINVLKTKLESAEKKLEDKCNKTKIYTDNVIDLLDTLGQTWDDESESAKTLIKAKELLMKLQKSISGTFEKLKITYQDNSVQVNDEGNFLLL